MKALPARTRKREASLWMRLRVVQFGAVVAILAGAVRLLGVGMGIFRCRPVATGL